MYKKIIASLVAISMTFNYVPLRYVIAEDSSAEPAITPIATNIQTQSDIPISPAYNESSETEHAYDPIAELEAQQEYRDSVDIVENTILFSVKIPSAEEVSYLDDSSTLSASYKLRNVEVLYENEKNGCCEVFYKASTSEDIWATVDKMNADSSISYAEPDFVWEKSDVGGYNVSGEEFAKSTHYPGLDIEGVWSWLWNNNNHKAPGDGVVVAVIDTGVDYTHIDLKDSMWKNTGEIAGNGKDDDDNGYIDDVYGYDFVEDDGNPMDDMGHGTHVAGIIGMSPKNGGGVGLAYGAKIMAIKAGQSTGSFSSSDIAKAIKYAADNGADVINMSFGGTGKSYLVEEALKDASHDCVLVASAGNDGLPTTDAPTPPYYLKEDFYPAGYNYVIGVMATDNDGNFANFSNWDYAIGANCEYEMAAPGVGIYSTLPGDRYANWSGTSMAAPNVAAAAAILRSKYTDKNKYTSRFIMGQLVSATNDSVTRTDNICSRTYPLLNIEDSLTNQPKPSIKLTDFYMFDDSSIASNNNGDGIAQPGEVINLGFEAFNYWGTAKDVTITVDAISVGGVPNPHIEFINNSVNIGGIGTFTTSNNGFSYTDGALTGVTKPVKIRIKDDTPNDVQIKLNFTVTGKNGLDSSDTATYTASGSYTIIVQNGVAISGVISEDMTLTKERFWIIENNLLIPEGVTVTVEPGTQIQFYSSEQGNPLSEYKKTYILANGQLNFNGSYDEPIMIFPNKEHENYIVSISGKSVNMDYVYIINPSITINNGNHLKLVQNYPLLYEQSGKGPDYDSQSKTSIHAQNLSNSLLSLDSHYQKSTSSDLLIWNKLDTCLLYKNSSKYNVSSASNCTFLKCIGIGSIDSTFIIPNSDCYFHNNAILNNIYNKNLFKIVSAGNSDISNNYWGSTNSSIIDLQIRDSKDDISLGTANYLPFLTNESEEMETIYPFVTEAYLTDKDGNRIDTVNGKQQVSLHVKFNRNMEQTIQPQVTYGGSEPYTDYRPNGTWVGAREWRADFTIDPDYDIGRMYIRIKGAVADDDRWLVTGEDTERFFFEITNTGAQAMKLQGEGCVGYNTLNWIQDDYDTLAGYNIYRSTSYDPSKDLKAQGFIKINDSLLSADELSYLDEAVEPCVDYYYYFTVMDTDMKESKASNVVTCMPTEAVPPVITHSAITSCNMGDTLTFNAAVTDNVEVTGAILHYRFADENEWKTLNMRNTNGSNYRVTLNVYSANNIEYYITATDSCNNTAFCGTQSEPVTIDCRYLTRSEIASLPDKILYEIGDDFEAAGLEVSAIYSDNTRETLADNAYNLMFNGDSEFDSSIADTITVTVEYNSKQAEFEVDVTESSGVWDTDDIEWHWDTFKQDGIVTAIIKRINDPTQTQTVNAAVELSSQSLAPSCIANGNNTYIATIELDNNTFSSSFTEVIGATGHHYYVTNAIWSDDNSSCTFNLKCFDCDESVDELSAEIAYNVTKEPTYSETGSITYTATAVYGQGAFSSTKTVELAKKERTSITSADVVISDNFFTYDGNEKVVSVSKVELDGILLTEGTDYEITDNTATAPGKYTLKIKGIGAFKGTIQRKWEIVRNYTVNYTINGVTKTEEYSANAYCNIEAPDIPGKDFSHWVLLNETPTKVSTDQSYNFRVTSNLSFEAIYVENGEPVEKVPVIAITDVRAINNRIYYEITRDIPDDYVVISNGILYGTSISLFVESDAESRDANIRFTDDSGSTTTKEKVYFGTSGVNSNKGYFSYYLNIGEYKDTRVYMRGYVIVKDSNNDIITYYTSITDKTYNELITN